MCSRDFLVFNKLCIPVAKFLVLEGHIVDSRIGLSYRSARPYRLADRNDYFLQSATKNLAPGKIAFYITMKLCTVKNVGPACILFDDIFF